MHCDSGEGWVRAIIFGAREKLFQRRLWTVMGGRVGVGKMCKMLYQKVLSAPGLDMI